MGYIYGFSADGHALLLSSAHGVHRRRVTTSGWRGARTHGISIVSIVVVIIAVVVHVVGVVIVIGGAEPPANYSPGSVHAEHNLYESLWEVLEPVCVRFEDSLE